MTQQYRVKKEDKEQIEQIKYLKKQPIIVNIPILFTEENPRLYYKDVKVIVVNNFNKAFKVAMTAIRDYGWLGVIPYGLNKHLYISLQSDKQDRHYGVIY